MECEYLPFSEFLEDLGLDSKGIEDEILDSLEDEDEQETNTTE